MKNFKFYILGILFIFINNIFALEISITNKQKIYNLPVLEKKSGLFVSFDKLAKVTDAELIFDPLMRKYIFQKDENLVQFVEMKELVYINKKIITISKPPFLHNGNIFLPVEILRHIKEWFKIKGYKVPNDQIVEARDRKSVVRAGIVPAVSKRRKARRIKYIIIDAGHGGKDPGALGQKGLQEKRVVLKVSLLLGEILKKQMPGVNIVLTRRKDVFIALRKRTSIANRYAKRDSGDSVFISIHANASMKNSSSGFESFYLCREATDEYARSVAAMENSVLDYENNKKPKGLIKKIIARLLDEEYIRESKELAKLIQKGYRRYLKGLNRGVKKAPFFVLEGVMMPAVLTEIGFITNRGEELKLRKTEYLRKLASAICNGIKTFVDQYNRSEGFTK